MEVYQPPSEPLIKEEEEEDPDDFYNDDDDGDSTSFKPRPQLSRSVVVVRHLAWLMDELEAGNIDVDPEYQREVVWTADRMTGLVNSLMENYYIPPIILNRKPLPNQGDGPIRHILVCVDGKQRLSSVQAFVKGIIPCNDHLGQKWYFCEHPQGRLRNVLSETNRKQFLAKEFVSFEFANLSTEQEEDLFARVQMGVQLNLAEKMRAATGVWQELGKLYVDDFSTIVSLLKDRSRAKDFQMVLSCFSQILEVQHPTNANGIPVLRTNHKALPKFLENRAALDDATKSHLRSVFKTFKELIELDPDTFTNVGRAFTRVQTFAPVEMVAISVLISVYSESRNNRLLIGDIRQFRTLLREHHKDLRMNAYVWKTTWNFIDNLEQIRGAVDGSTIDRTAQEPPPAPTEFGAEPEQPEPPTFLIVKRGRPTMRTKHPKVAPGTIITKKKPLALSNEVRPRKRPRLSDDPPPVEQDSALASSRSAIRSTVVPIGEPPPSATTLPQPSHPVLKQEPDTRPAAPAKIKRTAVQKATTTHNHENQISKPHDYRAPTAPMGTKASQAEATTTSAPLALPYHVSQPPYNPNIPLLSQAPNLGAAPTDHAPYPYGPLDNYIHQGLWQRSDGNPYNNLYVYGFPPNGPRPSSSPAAAQPRYHPPPPASPPPAAATDPTTPPQPPKSPAQNLVTATVTSPQSDIIDLTSDTEQERQDLLSSFRGRATNDRSLSSESAQHPRQPHTQTQVPARAQVSAVAPASASAIPPTHIQPSSKSKHVFPGDPRAGPRRAEMDRQASDLRVHLERERDRDRERTNVEPRRRNRTSKFDARIVQTLE
ncbi:hypothetical protein K491DRAFT_432601 [Lophiostoma macrostomum CBS 122681]|uniref:GmrSD restriction endonucleases N-terminal domain-containing protein n=1 Tax=Lophiostoma macrostomum CBS 122681 TaxID=1314788 RepID=A0A6A6T7K8_9PLEO|nr:hypothetical protein K491DRAFT_432601 [Lophiostoma macrostomum CBS 122681]